MAEETKVDDRVVRECQDLRSSSELELEDFDKVRKSEKEEGETFNKVKKRKPDGK